MKRAARTRVGAGWERGHTTPLTQAAGAGRVTLKMKSWFSAGSPAGQQKAPGRGCDAGVLAASKWIP